VAARPWRSVGCLGARLREAFQAFVKQQHLMVVHNVVRIYLQNVKHSANGGARFSWFEPTELSDAPEQCLPIQGPASPLICFGTTVLGGSALPVNAREARAPLRPLLRYDVVQKGESGK
jgi:hypothetical protein